MSASRYSQHRTAEFGSRPRAYSAGGGNESWRALGDKEPSEPAVIVLQSTPVQTDPKPNPRVSSVYDLGQRACPPGLFKWMFGGLWYGPFGEMSAAVKAFGGKPLEVLSQRRRCVFMARGIEFSFRDYTSAVEHFGGDPLDRLFFSKKLTFRFGSAETVFQSYEAASAHFVGCPWEQMVIRMHPCGEPDFSGPRWLYSMEYIPRVGSSMMTSFRSRNGFH